LFTFLFLILLLYRISNRATLIPRSHVARSHWFYRNIEWNGSEAKRQ